MREERNAGDRLGGVYTSRAQTAWIDLGMYFFYSGYRHVFAPLYGFLHVFSFLVRFTVRI